MQETVESDGKDVDDLEEEFRQSLRDAAEGETSSSIDSIKERIERKRKRSESDQ